MCICTYICVALCSPGSSPSASVPHSLIIYYSIYIIIIIVINIIINRYRSIIMIIISQGVSSEQRDPNPDENSLSRKRCCKRRMESLICRCLFPY